MKNSESELHQDNTFSFIREINYSFVNSDDKKLYEELNNLLRKKEYLVSKIKNIGENEKVPMNCAIKLL